MEAALLDAILFYMFGAVALASAVVVVAQRNPLYSAFALIVTMSALAALFGLLGSPFIAALQVVVYAGAIMVLFLFVLMLLNVKREELPAQGGRGLKAAALALSALLVVQVGMVLRRASPDSVVTFEASTRRVAEELFSPKYLYVFEATSILIVTALVGAVVLARRER